MRIEDRCGRMERGTLRIYFDAKEICPDDPGAGTPVVVSKRIGDDNYDNTFACAVDNGMDDVSLTDKEAAWLSSKEAFVDRWLTFHTAAERLRSLGCDLAKREDAAGKTRSGWWQDGIWIGPADEPERCLSLLNGIGC